MRVGFGQVRITPPTPVQLAGYGLERIAAKVAADLWARALAAELDGRRAVLLSVELLWLERRQVARLREQLATLCDLAPAEIMVCCTHTHSGPDTLDWFPFAPVDPAWITVLLKQLAAAVHAALDGLTDASVEKYVGSVDIGVNRRERTSEGIKLGVNPDGPIDRTLTVLRVRDAAGDYLGAVVHQATHPTVLGPQSKVICGDWPGEMCRVIEQVLGGVCLYINGACGDVNPYRATGRTLADAVRTGRQAAGAALELLSRREVEPVEALATATADVTVPHLEHPYLGTPLHRRLAEDGALILETQALRLGPVTFVTAPGECLVETGRLILERSRLTDGLIAGYGNDYAGYLPLPHIYEEGGYEARAVMMPADSVLAWVDSAVAVADRLA